ncbi:cornifelin-like isoform X3 [Simochromis diagramma]|uniref:cornifelin-like isoform X3 n=1 Tax=Simochromis diagramma TaxID=43689 RepID=UPI001A7E22FF|nr:cornifelin-like isoform X3 [Simochromis diagramma]
MAEKPLTDWDSGLLDCFEDARTCCYGFWCCPCLACTVSGRFGENNCLPLCDICVSGVLAAFGIPVCVPPAVLSVRAAMRNRYGIKGSLCKDIAISCFCEWCSWCQMHRELRHRKKTPTVINIQNNTVVNMQPIPTFQPGVMMMPAQPVATGFMSQPTVVVQTK